MNIQGIPATATPMASAPTSSSTSSNSTISESTFLQLIATELKAQDPTTPLDPSQFMGQLVQFGTLDQITAIHNLLASGVTAAGSTAPASSSGLSTSPPAKGL